MSLHPGACQAVPAPLGQCTGQHRPEVGIVKRVEPPFPPQPWQATNPAYDRLGVCANVSTALGLHGQEDCGNLCSRGPRGRSCNTNSTHSVGRI
eukprot:2916007-Alexandrium_andersonii.AAC.1